MKKRYTFEDIKVAFEDFKNRLGYYPTALEIDSNLFDGPTSRTIQRKFGGLVNLRKALKLDIVDYTKGTVRRETVIRINKLHSDFVYDLYKTLVGKYGPTRVHADYELDYGTSKRRYDLYLYTPDNKFFIVECFYASNNKTLYGCLNAKIKKHRSLQQIINKGDYTFIYLNINNDLPNICSLTSKFKPNEHLIHLKDLKNMLK